MIPSCFVYLLSFVVAQANLIDGPSVSGELKAIDPQQMVMVVGDQERTFPVDRLQELTLPIRDEPSQTGPQVTLLDGSQCRADSLQVSKAGQAELAVDGAKVTCDAASITAVRYFLDTDDTLQKQWAEILESRGSEDFLVVNKQGNLDYLAGVVGELGGDKLAFVYGGSSLDIPMSRVAGLVFAKRPALDGSPRAVIRTVHGSAWQVRDFRMQGDSLQIATLAKASGVLPLAHIRSIEFIRMGVDYLSDLEPETVRYRPFFPSPVAGERIQILATPKRDTSFHGMPLQVSDDGKLREFEKGLAVQSRTELTYRLAKKYQRFQAFVGFDPEAADHGDVELRIFADQQEVFQGSISKQDPSVALDVPVANANRMTILVDFGKNLDIGDRLHLGGAKLLQ